jgi:hypothetical protein
LTLGQHLSPAVWCLALVVGANIRRRQFERPTEWRRHRRQRPPHRCRRDAIVNRQINLVDARTGGPHSVVTALSNVGHNRRHRAAHRGCRRRKGAQFSNNALRIVVHEQTFHRPSTSARKRTINA